MTGDGERPLNAVLIGLGMVAATHVRALADLRQGITLRGVAARDHAKVQEFAGWVEAETGLAPKAYADVAEVAGDPEVDFVVLTTPPNARAEIVLRLAGAGKHILLEKPVERDGAAAAQIVEICEDAGVTLGIVFQHRMREASQKLTELMETGKLGALRIADIRVPWWRDQAYYDEPGRGSYERDGGGVMISQAIHTLDLALSLTGPVQAVTAFAATSGFHKMESEDFVTSGLEFANGAIGSLVASTAFYPGEPETISLHCERGRADLARGELKVTRFDGSTEVFGATAEGTGGGADPMAFTHDWHAGVIENFADALRQGRAPLVTGREALRVHRLIDALTLSASEGRRVELREPGETV